MIERWNMVDKLFQNIHQNIIEIIYYYYNSKFTYYTFIWLIIDKFYTQHKYYFIVLVEILRYIHNINLYLNFSLSINSSDEIITLKLMRIKSYNTL